MLFVRIGVGMKLALLPQTKTHFGLKFGKLQCQIIINHLWRLAKNILPSRCNLIKKGIQLDTICPLCKNGEESVDHMVMKCSVMKMALFASQIGAHIPQNMHYH